MKLNYSFLTLKQVVVEEVIDSKSSPVLILLLIECTAVKIWSNSIWEYYKKDGTVGLRRVSILFLMKDIINGLS